MVKTALLHLGALSVLLAVSGRRSSWLDRPDTAFDDPPPSAGCLNCVGPGGGGGGAAGGRVYDADLDPDEIGDLLPPGDAPSAAKRTPTIQDLCDITEITRGRGRTALVSCTCKEGYQPLKLGEGYYPHHLSVVKCADTSHCLTRYFRVPLLTRRSVASQGLQGLRDLQAELDDDTLLVPETLRKHWRFEFKAIPVACECVT